MRVWLDDLRPMPEGYDVHAWTAAEALELLKSGRVTAISLDHDLGDDAQGTGYDVAKWIEEAAYRRTVTEIELSVHSQNSVGVSNMNRAIANARRFWLDQAVAG